jgi:hypothetical protein
VKPAGILFALTLALFTFQATGALQLMAAGACTQVCADDDAQGRCADTCSDCSCCFHPRPMARFAAPLPETPVAGLMPRREAAPAYASAPAHEILHIPISLLA